MIVLENAVTMRPMVTSKEPVIIVIRQFHLSIITLANNPVNDNANWSVVITEG